MSLKKLAVGVVAVAATAEIGMVGYTEIVPDFYKDFTVASCTKTSYGGVEFTALGKDGDTYRERTLVLPKSQAIKYPEACPTSQKAELNSNSMTCTFKTYGQYIPLAGIYPSINWEGTKCAQVTPEQLIDLRAAQVRNDITSGLVVRMMK